MSYKAHIKDRESGVVSVKAYPYEWTEERNDHYWWSEGNFACDCNRFLEFERGLGREPKLAQAQCNLHLPKTRFIVEKIVDDNTGKVLYREDE